MLTGMTAPKLHELVSMNARSANGHAMCTIQNKGLQRDGHHYAFVHSMFDQASCLMSKFMS